MVNLKNLNFASVVHHQSAPILLRKCAFQLEGLTWRGVGSEEELYTNFLATQHRLLHLNINSSSYTNKPPLPDGLCPSLTSIACSLLDFARLSATRPIVALQVGNDAADIPRASHTDVMSASERERCITALKRIRYLQLWALPPFYRFTRGITLQEVTVLQLCVWNIEV